MSKVKELERRLRDEPQNLGLRVALAGAYREAGRLSDAVELYRSVAMAYRDQGRTQQAVAVCKSLLDIAPNDVASKALLASLAPPPPPPPPVRPIAENVDIEVGTLVAAPVIPERPAQHLIVRPPIMPSRDSSSQSGPRRRSSMDETPLPTAVPYHVHDPTTANLKKLSSQDLITQEEIALPVTEATDVGDTGRHSQAAERTQPSPPPLPAPRRPHTPSVAGIANAARRISSALVGDASDRDAIDVSAELDTRQRPRLESAEVERLSKPPPTVPFQRADLDDADDDLETPAPGVEHRDEDRTEPRDMVGSRARAPTSSMLTTQFFAPLPAERRGAVLQRFSRRTVDDGSTLIHQGEIGHPLVLVTRGRLDVRAERADGKMIQVGTVALGEYVGEVALLHRVPAAAHVIANGEVEVLLLPPRDFYELAGAFPALWAELKDVAERRQREFEYRMRATR